MSKVFFLFLTLTVCLSFTNSSIATAKGTNEKCCAGKKMELTGKTLEYNYGDAIYQLKFISGNSLHWKCVKGEEKGLEADETFKSQYLNNHSVFVSWIETNGVSVSQVLNLKDNTVHCYLFIEKDIITLKGSIRQLN